MPEIYRVGQQADENERGARQGAADNRLLLAAKPYQNGRAQAWNQGVQAGEGQRFRRGDDAPHDESEAERGEQLTREAMPEPRDRADRQESAQQELPRPERRGPACTLVWVASIFPRKAEPDF